MEQCMIADCSIDLGVGVWILRARWPNPGCFYVPENSINPRRMWVGAPFNQVTFSIRQVLSAEYQRNTHPKMKGNSGPKLRLSLYLFAHLKRNITGCTAPINQTF